MPNAGKITLIAVPDIEGLPAAEDVSLDDAQLIRETRAAWDTADERARGWAGTEDKLLAAEAALEVLELPGAKTDAIAEISAYVDLVNYRDAEAAAVAEIIANASQSIEDAESTASVAAILLEAKQHIDAVKTDAQLSAEELVSAKEAAAAQVRSVLDPTLYREREAAILRQSIDEALEDIAQATTPEAVQTALEEHVAAIQSLDIKTDAQLTAEEAAQQGQQAQPGGASTEQPDASAPAAQQEQTGAVTVTVNTKTVTSRVIASAIVKAKTNASSIKTIVLGKKVRVIKKRALAKCKAATTLVIKTTKLTKKSVKGCLAGSKIKTVKVPKAKKKAYKKLFTKKICGKKVTVK